jgi:hypothetical protein
MMAPPHQFKKIGFDNWIVRRLAMVESQQNLDDVVNVVSMQNIVKRFPGVLANDHVNFDLRQGENSCPAG